MTKEQMYDFILESNREIYAKTKILKSENQEGAESIIKTVAFLDEMKEVHPTDICKYLNVSTPRVTKILNDMDERKLITRTISKQDRRQVTVKLSSEGKKFVEKRKQHECDWLSRLIDKTDEKDAEAFVKYVKAFIEILDEDIAKLSPQ